MTSRRHFPPDKGVDPTTGLPRRVSTFRCVCGKAAFTSRRAARSNMRRTFPSQRMQVYRCERGTGLDVWHYGHPWGHERKP